MSRLTTTDRLAAIQADAEAAKARRRFVVRFHATTGDVHVDEVLTEVSTQEFWASSKLEAHDRALDEVRSQLQDRTFVTIGRVQALPNPVLPWEVL